MLSKTGFAIGVVCILIAGCSTSAPVPGSTSQAIVYGGPGIWVSPQGGYANECECIGGGCGCVQDQCQGDPDGQPCGPIGATCNAIGLLTYEVLECVSPPLDPYVGPWWTRTTTDSCFDECNRQSCSCIRDLCGGNPEGQACSTPGAVCNVVDGPSWFELTCE
jgi:hypothetical protein